MLSSRVESGTSIRSGRPRRYYSIQAGGVRALNEARKTFTDIWRGFRVPIAERA